MEKILILTSTKEYDIIVFVFTSRFSARAMVDAKKFCLACEQVSRLDRGTWRVAEMEVAVS